jgi:hypothetical protein
MQTQRQRSDQFAALGFVQESATHAGADQMQLRFTHGAFTRHRRSPSTKLANSTRSAARNQLFLEAKMVTGSFAARSVSSAESHTGGLFVEETNSLFTAVFFARQSFELAAR